MESPSPVLRATNDYDAMVALGRRSGLETSSLTKVLAAFGFFVGDKLVGCACLREANGIFMIECLAVDEEMRGRGLGSSLVRKVEEEARARGISTLWAVARQPGFFLVNGYRRTSGREAGGPSLDDCSSCSQYLKGCEPAVVAKDL